MRATGIVRRIDDLGRIVIPKEVRRILHIRNGDPIEIFTDKEGNVILRKYSPIGELKLLVDKYVETLSKVIKHDVLITDLDMIVAASRGAMKEIGKPISQQLENIILVRELVNAVKIDKKYIKISDFGMEEYGSQVICPIISESNVIGVIAFLDRNSKVRMNETEQSIAQFAASFLGHLMEQ